ncbi:hypothetical protein FJY63_05815, partial [Candidatus Sumerlaeota bacterium]|nr:hypothetical protein [Candidatus Sumerlaeota bacterium]
MNNPIHRKAHWLAVTATVAFGLALFDQSARAGALESYRKLWRDPALTARIEAYIEKHRKS